jgi:hypothetical protein
MRNFQRSLAIGTGITLVAGAMAIAAPAAAAPSAPLAPRAGFPSTSGLEIRNDAVAERYQPAIEEAEMNPADMMTCAAPMIPERTDAQFRPMDTKVGKASGTFIGGMAIED